MTTAEVQTLGLELGLDALGVTRAVAYEGTERHIRERRARGLFGRLRFTTAQPEVSCHPERLLAGARSVVSAALCYWTPERERPRRLTREEKEFLQEYTDGGDGEDDGNADADQEEAVAA